MSATGTYVYCLVAAPTKPAVHRARAGLPGAGEVRLLGIPGSGRLKQWLVVADVPLNRYGEETINRRLNDLDWVSRAAVAHEDVVESFIGSTALLPMKLFTIFTSDDSAVEHIDRQRARIAAAISRVANHLEWGVRVVLDRAKPAARRPGARAASGSGYLAGKKAQLDASAELANRARATVVDLYEELSSMAAEATRRLPGELPVKGGPLLLDAAFLVPKTRNTRFATAVSRRARGLKPKGYLVTLTGPWPPYSFVRE